MNPAHMNLNPMTQIDPVVIVAMVLIVSVTFVLLRRFFVLPYLRVLEERERLFETSDDRLDEADSCVQAAEVAAEEAVAMAATEAEKIRADAQEAADAYRTKCLGAATAEATRTLEDGREAIAADRTEELGRLRDQTCECVRLACERLLGRADDDAVAAAVDRALARHGG